MPWLVWLSTCFSEKLKKKDVRGPYTKVQTKTSKRRTVQCRAPGGRQNGRRKVERERKDGQIIEWFNYSKLFSGSKLPLSFFFNLFHNAVVFFQLSMTFVKLLWVWHDLLTNSRGKIQSHGLLGDKNHSQFVQLAQNDKHNLQVLEILTPAMHVELLSRVALNTTSNFPHFGFSQWACV